MKKSRRTRKTVSNMFIPILCSLPKLPAVGVGLQNEYILPSLEFESLVLYLSAEASTIRQATVLILLSQNEGTWIVLVEPCL